MNYKIINDDNMKVELYQRFDLIYCDMIYENTNLSWISHFWKYLSPSGIFMIQTDWHTDYLVRSYMDNILPMTLGHYEANFVNHLVWKNEWGNHPKDRFHQCYDDILIYSHGKIHKFYSDRIQIDKVTKNKGLNPSGRETKTATAWIDDICLTTASKERVKKNDGHLIPWQKPIKLFDRIIAPFTDEGDNILDPFMGSGSLGEWCIKNNRNYVGIEMNPEICKLAEARMNYGLRESK